MCVMPKGKAEDLDVQLEYSPEFPAQLKENSVFRVGGGLLGESPYCLIPRSNYLKSVEYIDTLNLGNPLVSLILSLIIDVTIPLSPAADVPIYAHAVELPLLLSSTA